MRYVHWTILSAWLSLQSGNTRLKGQSEGTWHFLNSLHQGFIFWEQTSHVCAYTASKWLNQWCFTWTVCGRSYTEFFFFFLKIRLYKIMTDQLNCWRLKKYWKQMTIIFQIYHIWLLVILILFIFDIYITFWEWEITESNLHVFSHFLPLNRWT